MWAPNFRDTWMNFIDSQLPYLIVDDCLVDSASGLIYKNGDIVWEASNENLVWTSQSHSHDWISLDHRWENRRSRIKLIAERMDYLKIYFDSKLNSSNQILVESDLCLHLLHPFGRYVPGHIFDTMQKIYTAECNNFLYDTCLLADPREMIDFDLHLKALGLDGNNNLFSEKNTIFKVKKLLFIQPLSTPTTFTKESFMLIRKKYFYHFNLSEDAQASKQLFLIRRKNKFKRNIINENQIENLLSKANVTIVDGSESFPVLINLFSTATHVAGVHGSLFMNTIFGNKNARYLEYCPKSRVVPTFKNAYKLCESYEFHLSDSNSAHDIFIEPEELLKFYSS